MLTPDSVFTEISWMQPPYSPSNYNISYSCQLSCNSSLTDQGTTTVESTTTYTISSLPPDSSCSISVIAVYGGIGMSNAISSTTNTLSLGNNNSSE